MQSDPDLCVSTANARAYVVRAELYAETRRPEAALRDAEMAIELLLLRSAADSPAAGNVLQARAYRVSSDVREQSGDYQAAADALRAMALCNPALRSKVTIELERLQQRANASK